ALPALQLAVGRIPVRDLMVARCGPCPAVPGEFERRDRYGRGLLLGNRDSPGLAQDDRPSVGVRPAGVLGAFSNPPLDEGDLLGRERVLLVRHAGSAVRANQLDQIALVGLAGSRVIPSPCWPPLASWANVVMTYLLSVLRGLWHAMQLS